MPAKDIYHNAVKFALVKDGWDILTEDYNLEYGGDRLYVNIAAEKSRFGRKARSKNSCRSQKLLGSIIC
ncbi:element excision factor XisH family protein [Scytonema sp. UIC 10036]|uniref:element excision factor XisH family protein n=1 Tax=Scytonema sp. UIC 10036 TaxID=2304196 RepID=UPI00242B0427|nr:element excision factor XisH family protein [Scytonema sp. UIC 10036]